VLADAALQQIALNLAALRLESITYLKVAVALVGPLLTVPRAEPPDPGLRSPPGRRKAAPPNEN
jgi:hypothetical protein